MSRICVLIPVLNESRTIAEAVGAVRARGLDVVVVDDGSTDNSGPIARGAGAFVIRHDQRRGKGGSLRDGFRHILQKGYEAVITLDGDGQHDPVDIDQFTQLAGRISPGMIVGNRMATPRGMPPVRYLTNRFMSLLISWACRQNIPDTQCGYRYIHRDVLREVPLSCDDFEIETEMLMKAAKRGFQIHSVPILTIYRNEESKINPVKDTVRFIAYFSKELLSP
ncbi:MAG: glycosyltransferase family 2 protein [Candidatus Omnitrophica bacterium]|nr:glycosyltransferase family 2 protein [Candidatus Omnitrophota bacterium]